MLKTGLTHQLWDDFRVDLEPVDHESWKTNGKEKGRRKRREEVKEKKKAKTKRKQRQQQKKKLTFDVFPHALRDRLDPIQRVVEVEEHGLDRRAVWRGERAARRHLFLFLVSEPEEQSEGKEEVTLSSMMSLLGSLVRCSSPCSRFASDECKA